MVWDLSAMLTGECSQEAGHHGRWITGDMPLAVVPVTGALPLCSLHYQHGQNPSTLMFLPWSQLAMH